MPLDKKGSQVQSPLFAALQSLFCFALLCFVSSCLAFAFINSFIPLVLTLS